MNDYVTTIRRMDNYPEKKWIMFIIEFEELLNRYDLNGWIEC